MTSLITHSLTYNEQSVLDYFVTPLFVDGAISDYSTVITGIKSNYKIDKFSALSKITKPYAKGSSFTSSTGVTYTQRTVTVGVMKAEAKQNGHEFLNSVKQQLLKSGVDMNDVGGTLLEEIVLEVFKPALEADIARQSWFNDTTKTTLSSGVPTATADTDYNQYTGWWTTIFADFASGAISSSYKVSINSSTYQNTVAVAQVTTSTLTGTSGTANITFNGTAYLATFATSLTVTAAAFVTSWAATIAARYSGVVVTSSGADVIFTATQPGVAFSASAPVNVSGTLAGSVAATTANVINTTLKTDAASTAMASMLANGAPELVGNSEGLMFHCTRSWYDNYLATLRTQSGSEGAFTMLVDGRKMLTYAGIPIMVHFNWDAIISTDFTGQYPHRCLLTRKENLITCTDGSEDTTVVKSFYYEYEEERIFRCEYIMGVNYADSKFICAAY